MKIRKATPKDAAYLAKAILIAGRAHVKKGIWEVILGGSEKKCELFLQNISTTHILHLFHYACFIVAEENGVGPIGSLGGYNPELLGYPALQEAIPEAFKNWGGSKQTFNDLQERASKILVCLPKEIEGAWVIDSVATLPGHRGKGTAEALLNRIMGEGKKRGHKKVQINVYIGNEPALALYSKLGFERVEENRNAYFEKTIGSPGMLSLARKL